MWDISKKFQSSARQHLTSFKFLKFTRLIRYPIKIIEAVTIIIESTFWPAELPSRDKRVPDMQLSWVITQKGVAFCCCNCFGVIHKTVSRHPTGLFESNAQDLHDFVCLFACFTFHTFQTFHTVLMFSKAENMCHCLSQYLK